MKKLRGLRKYYRKLETENDLEKANWLDFEDPELWLDHWHLHFDWWGMGNTSFKKRKPHLDKLFRHFELLEEETQKLKIDFQLFAIIFDYDSWSDALYIHTPNPNNNFPRQYEKVRLESTLSNPDLERYLNEYPDYEKLYGTGNENFCVLFKKGLGVAPQSELE